MKKLLLYSFILLLPFMVFLWQAPFLGGLSIGNDYGAFPIRYQLELMFSLAHGSFPLYIPGFAGGHSAAALTLGQFYHPISHLSSIMPGYWQGYALEWNTFYRLLSLGIAHLLLFILLLRLGLRRIPSFILSFLAVYNLRMLDLFRYGASLENYTGYLFLCAALGFYYLKPDKFRGPLSIIISTYLLVSGGHPQMMYLGLLGAAIAWVAIPFVFPHITGTKEPDRQRMWKYLKVAAICVFCGIILASAYTLPFYFDFLQANAQRAGQGYEWSTKYASSLSGMANGFFAPLQSEVHGAFGSSSLILIVLVAPLLYLFRQRIPLAITGLWLTILLIFLCGLGKATPVHYLFWKYFPLAGNFRAPGRITMLFPFLFLLVMAWLFISWSRLKPENFRFSYFFAPLSALALFLLYHAFLSNALAGPRKYTPDRIQGLPGWLFPFIFWLGLASLVLLLLYFLFRDSGKTVITGLLLALAVMLQTGLELRFGTWVIEKTKQPTLSMMAKQKRKSLSYNGDPGFGMESKTVFTQKQHSILDPYLAKFYRQHKDVSSQEQAYNVLAKENVTRTVVVETNQTTHPWPRIEQKKSVDDAGLVELKYSSYNRLVFGVRASAQGYFTLSYPFSGNWRATVNGKDAEIYRANGYMQAVRLGPGMHRVEFRYRGQATFFGIVISLVSFLTLGIYFTLISTGVKKGGKVRMATIAVVVGITLFFFLSYYLNLYSGDNLGTDYTWTPSKFPPESNLAYGKATKMGMGRHLYCSGYGVDGYIGMPFGTLKKSGGWWQVDLGRTRSLGDILLFTMNNPSATPLPLTISGSVDGETFTVLTRLDKHGPGNPWRIGMNGAITRFVRLMPQKKEEMFFKEVEIYPFEPWRVPAKGLKLPAPLHSAGAKRLMDFLGDNVMADASGDDILDVWQGSGRGAKEVSPALHIMGKRGEFDLRFRYRRRFRRSRLTVKAESAGKDGRWLCLLGFNAGKRGFLVANPGDKYLVLMVKAYISGQYNAKENYLFIQDFNGKWQKSLLNIEGQEQRTYVLWKKIRKDSTQLNMGIRFSPSSAENRLMVDDIKIMVTERTLVQEQ